jgi:hypothetical protein
MWITPTAATIQDSISGPEFTALKSAARGAGQNPDTLVTDCLSRSIKQIIGYVSVKNIVGTAGDIPDELTAALGAVWRFEFINRLGLEKLLTESRKTAYDNAMIQLRDVAAGRFTIMPPATPAPEAQQAGGPGVQLASFSPRQASREDLSGLL